MTILSKVIYTFNGTPVTNGISHNYNNNFTILHENTKTPQIDKAILRKKNRAGDMKFSDFGLYYKATVIKTVWYWHKNRSIDQ